MNILKNALLLSFIWASCTAEAASMNKGAEPGEEIISTVFAMGVKPAVEMAACGDECEGPFERLVILNANIIDGAGAPTQGPVTLEIERDRIVAIHTAGTGSVATTSREYGSETRVSMQVGSTCCRVLSMPTFISERPPTDSQVP